MIRVRAAAIGRGDRGSATVWMIGVTVSAFLLVGLVLDGGTMLRARSDAFSAAGAAARVGAQQLDPDAAVEGLTVLDPIAAERAVQDYLAASGLTGTARVVDDTVTVTVTTEAQLQMLRLVGGDTVTFDATATVEAVKVETP
ncbi:MAG: pilus assembly protein TadG-related protein [Acidimicrobiales bacterium]